MKARIIRIGNSQGLRIPKALLAQCNLVGDVELEVRDGQLLIRSADAPRRGWEPAFAAMAAVGDDALPDGTGGSGSRWDEEEWEW